MFVVARYIYVSASFNFRQRDQFSSNGEITIRDCSLKESRFLLGTFFMWRTSVPTQFICS